MFSISLAVCFIFACLIQVDAAPRREKRALWELDTVISCYTGRSGFDYNGYGCWCGLGGSGRPVDDTDTCCMAHDYCYQALMDEGCGVYFTSYGYSKRNCASGRGEIVCAGSFADPDPSAVCHFKLCECDRQIASCLARYRNSYRNAFANYEKRLCDPKLALPARPVVAYQVDTESSNSSTSVVVGDETGAYQQVAPERGVYQQVLDEAPQGERGANEVPVDAQVMGANQEVVDEAPVIQGDVYQQMFDIASRINAQQQVLDGVPDTGVQHQQAAPVYKGVYRQVKHKSKAGPLV